MTNGVAGAPLATGAVDGPGTAGGSPLPTFNKMFVMIPVMLLARQINADDPVTIQYVRLAYGCVQLLCVVAVAYVYVQASRVTDPRIVYIPAPKTVRANRGATMLAIGGDS